MKNRNSKDIFVVITSLIICIFALYAFWIFHNFKEVNNRVEVAWIHVLNGSCFIKRAESSKWIKAYNDYNLYFEDEVKLDSGSVVELLFADGQKAVLLENSFIVITENRKGTVLNVIGNCEGLDLSTSSEAIYIKTENENILKVDKNSSVKITVKKQTIDASVAQGKLLVINDEGVEKSVTQGSGFVLDFEGGMQRKPVVVTFPLNYECFTEDKNGTVFFKWNKNNTNIQFVKIEIFADKNFQKSILEKIIEADNNSCQIVVPQGLYFWRFSAMGSDGAVIEVPEIFQSGKISVK
ncbi:MAG: hypothetical protein SPJ44_08775 [Treponema sp.]|nr:hypothetical protein [Treponema sp.]